MNIDQINAVVKKLWGKNFSVVPGKNHTYLLHHSEDGLNKAVPQEGNIETEGNTFKVRFTWFSQACDFADNLRKRGYVPRMKSLNTENWMWIVVEFEVA